MYKRQLESDSQKTCDTYNEIIRQQGGIDLQLLGLGHNGHIGFNEPGAAFEKETHCVDPVSYTHLPFSGISMIFRFSM